MVGPATALEDVLEQDWQRQVVDLAKQFGWRVYHTFNSRKSDHGFPDLVLIRDRIVYLELKREKTGPTDKQKEWIRGLLAAGAEAYIARPRDIEAVARILASRRPPWESHDRTTAELGAALLASTRAAVT